MKISQSLESMFSSSLGIGRLCSKPLAYPRKRVSSVPSLIFHVIYFKRLFGRREPLHTTEWGTVAANPHRPTHCSQRLPQEERTQLIESRREDSRRRRSGTAPVCRALQPESSRWRNVTRNRASQIVSLSNLLPIDSSLPLLWEMAPK